MEIINSLMNRYLSIEDLKYNTREKFLLNNEQIRRLIEAKEELVENGDERFIRIDLPTFNSQYIYFAKCNELLTARNEFLNLMISDFNDNNASLNERVFDDIISSRIFSEVEGTMNVENVPTTRRRTAELIENKREPQNEEDIIVINMNEGINFVLEGKSFNKENLLELYTILSKDCLLAGQEIPDGMFYRNDEVNVGGYDGCPYDKIDKYMDDLFIYVNNCISKKINYDYLAHIAHYYILYIHPYFDFNGRTARMVSLWINKLCGHDLIPYFISEAINQNKKKYYKALVDSREMKNDITYFLKYVFNISISYFYCYKNIEEICKELLKKNIILTQTERHYFKLILLSNDSDFTYKMFLKYINNNMSKQAALKILNNFEEYGLLTSRIVSSKEKVFRIKDNVVIYKMCVE